MPMQMNAEMRQGFSEEDHPRIVAGRCSQFPKVLWVNSELINNTPPHDQHLEITGMIPNER